MSIQETTTMASKKTKIEAAPAAVAQVAAIKVGPVKSVAPKAAAVTGIKAGTPKASAKKVMPKVAPRLVAPVTLTDKQANFLKSIRSTGQAGYKGDKKGDLRAIEALLGKGLIKKAAKDKASGAYHYTVSKAGEKHLGTPTS